MIGVIIRERSTWGMKPEMLELYEAFPTMNPGQFRKVMKNADWIEAPEDTVICTKGDVPKYLFLVSNGGMQLQRSGKKVTIDAGNFILI